MSEENVVAIRVVYAPWGDGDVTARATRCSWTAGGPRLYGVETAGRQPPPDSEATTRTPDAPRGRHGSAESQSRGRLGGVSEQGKARRSLRAGEGCHR
jgi:hypothetical protein